MTLKHRHEWVLEVLEFHFTWIMVVSKWKCNCGETKQSREYL